MKNLGSLGRRGCNGVAGNGWGEEAAGDERAWLRGRLRTGNGSEMFAESFAGRGRDSMLDITKPWKYVEIAWGELRWEGARQHAGRRGNRAKLVIRLVTWMRNARQ